MPKSKHAAPVGETGSGADSQAQGNHELSSTNNVPREAAGDDALLRLIAGMAADGGGRYLRKYNVSVTLTVSTVAEQEGGEA